MSEEDPLDGADIGETVRIEETVELWAGAISADETRGSDRFANHEVADIEVVEDEYGEKIVRLSVESDVTKRLPHCWSREPNPKPETEKNGGLSWRFIAGRLAPPVVAIGIGVWVTQSMFRALAGESIEFAAEPPTLAVSVITIVALMVVMLLVIAAIPHLPRIGGRRSIR